MTSEAGDLTGVERIYLDPDRPARADVPRPSRSLGRIYPGRVAFAGSGPILLVAQGVETALALRTVRPDLPAAATPRPRPPAGSSSAAGAARSPPPSSPRALGDFSRDLLAHGPEALAERLRGDGPPVAWA